MRAKRSSAKFSRVSTKTEGAPRFLCHQSVILGGKPSPFWFRFSSPTPPRFPYFNSDASPVERIAEASMRSSPTPSRKERSRRAAAPPTSHRRSSKAPCVCVRGPIVVRGRLMVSEANGREPDSAATARGGNPHGCADKAAGEGGREREREGQGRRVPRYFCNAQLPQTPARFRLCWVAISRVATS